MTAHEQQNERVVLALALLSSVRRDCRGISVQFGADGVRVRRTKAGIQVRKVAFSRSIYAVLMRPSSTCIACIIASACSRLPCANRRLMRPSRRPTQ